MKTTYRSIDGKHFTAESTDSLVAQLREDSRTPSRSQLHFMAQVRRRAWLQAEVEVHLGSTERFVQDLISGGLLQVVNCDECRGPQKRDTAGCRCQRYSPNDPTPPGESCPLMQP